jgi:purine-nucleoside phosphorylase
MSTIPEVIMAKALGVNVVGISCITNKAAGLSENPLSHIEVQEIAAKVAPVFRKLLKGIITRVAQQHLA